MNPYRVLGVNKEATEKEIRQAYLEAVRQCPPEQNEQRFLRIRQAYECISDEKKRSQYFLLHAELPDAEDVLLPLAASPAHYRPDLKTLYQLLLPVS